jgi:hypothetical protein
MELIVIGAYIVGNGRTTYLKHFGCDACEMFQIMS